MDITAIQNELMAYITENSFKELNEFDVRTKIFMEGILDSMGFVLLLEHLEDNYAVKAEDNELVESNFESVASIADFITRKRL